MTSERTLRLCLAALTSLFFFSAPHAPTSGPYLFAPPTPPPIRGKKKHNKLKEIINLTHRKRGYLNKDSFFLQLIHKIIISTSKLALFSFKFI